MTIAVFMMLSFYDTNLIFPVLPAAIKIEGYPGSGDQEPENGIDDGLAVCHIIADIVPDRTDQIKGGKADEQQWDPWKAPDPVRPFRIGHAFPQHEDPHCTEPVCDPGNEDEHIRQHIKRSGDDEYHGPDPMQP